MKPERPTRPSLPLEVLAALEEEEPSTHREAARVWDLLEQARPAPLASPAHEEAAWRRLQRALPAHGPRRPQRPRRMRLIWTSTAVTAFLLLALAVSSLRPVTISTPGGVTLTAALPDGSTVELNGGSYLTYARGFRTFWKPAEVRTVRLEGEAFFDVVQDGRPFLVETINARIEVLGTTFNVKARAGSYTETSVTLASGRVRVVPTDPAEASVLLTAPGQTARIGLGDLPPSSPQPRALAQVLTWREGGFAVAQQPLLAVFEELAQRYGVEITVRNPEVITDSLTYIRSEPTPVDTLLDDICTAKSLQYRATLRGYEVFRPISR